MSEAKMFRVRLIKGATFNCNHGKFVKGRDHFVRESDRGLSYYKTRPTRFEVLDADKIPPVQLPPTLARRRNKAKAMEAAKPAPVAPPAPATPKLEIPDDEKSVVGAAIVYKESGLRVMKRAELVKIAVEEFGLKVGSGDLKKTIIAKILDAD